MAMRTYNQLSQSAVYREDEIAVSLTVCGGSYGGGTEVILVECNEQQERLTPERIREATTDKTHTTIC